MDVFSLLNFWHNAGVGNAADIDIPCDDGSFFDLVFTNPTNLEHNVIDSKSDHTQTVFFNNKRKILPLDSSRSPFRVLKLGFQNTKTKKKIEEATMLKSDNSLRNKLSSEKLLEVDQTPSKRFSKDVVHKYLNLIKPLYVRVSGRSNQKIHANPATAVFKHLRKSRSSSSSAGKPTPSPAARSYDSALQQDGIQSAILHCKKSYSSPSRGCDVLSRSGSAPSQRSRISIDEVKRSSI